MKSSWKSLLKVSWLMLLAIFMMASCEDEPEEEPIPVEDGYYVFGAGTALTDYDFKGLMKVTRNEVDQTEREGLLELYIAVEAGTAGFNIGKVEGGKAKVYGPGADFAEVLEANKIGDEPRLWFARGAVAETETKFTVPENGLYHVVYDVTTGIVAVAKVEWGIIGGATPEGWGTSTAMTSSSFDKNAMSFEVTELILLAGEFKFRYSNGWKIVIDGEAVRVNTNYGGAVDALVPGGSNIANTVVGVYTVRMDWSLEDGNTATLTKTGDYEPPTYPDAMYIAGEAVVYGWNPGSANSEMHKLAGGGPSEGIFWKICHIEGGLGFKLANANWTEPNLDYSEVNTWDPNGVTVTAAGGNWTVENSGMYVVVLNLRDNLVQVSIKEAAVYGIGDAFGGWDAGVEANMFTVDNENKILVSPALPAAGNIRMYAAHAWIPAWWNAEFNVYSGVIEYRNDGGDQAAVAGTAGQIITLHFDDNTGTIQ